MKIGEAAKDDLLGLLMESIFREIKEHGNNRLKGISVSFLDKRLLQFCFLEQ